MIPAPGTADVLILPGLHTSGQIQGQGTQTHLSTEEHQGPTMDESAGYHVAILENKARNFPTQALSLSPVLKAAVNMEVALESRREGCWPWEPLSSGSVQVGSCGPRPVCKLGLQASPSIFHPKTASLYPAALQVNRQLLARRSQILFSRVSLEQNAVPDPAHCFPESCPDKPHVGWLLAGPLGLNPKGQQGHAPADGGPMRASPGAAWARCGASAGQGRGGKSSPAQPASGVKQVIPLRPAGAGASLLPAGSHLREQHWGRSRAVGTGPSSPGRRSRPGSRWGRLRPPGVPARAPRPLAIHLPPTPHSPAHTVPAASPGAGRHRLCRSPAGPRGAGDSAPPPLLLLPLPLPPPPPPPPPLHPPASAAAPPPASSPPPSAAAAAAAAPGPRPARCPSQSPAPRPARTALKSPQPGRPRCPSQPLGTALPPPARRPPRREGGRASGRGASGREQRTAGARGAGGPAKVPSSSPPRASAFTSGSGDARPATRLCLSPAHGPGPGPEVQLRTGQWTQSWGPGGSRPLDASGPGWPRSRRRARTLAGKHRRTLTRHTLAPACPRWRVETDVGFAQELETREGSEPEPCNSPRSANTRLPLLKASRSPPTAHICHWRGRRRPRPRGSIAGQTELPVRAPELPEKLTWAQVKIAAVAQKWPGSSKEKRNRLLPKGEEFDSRGCCLPRFPLSLAPQKRPEGDRPDAGGQRASREPTSSCRTHSRVAC
ncbi:uncharacterized protein [Macaca fascicularis]|uniref:uncharacterized protein n=1 Tax=Macaca fascicularis TaxID=9541 RepID=UPI003D15CBE8